MLRRGVRTRKKAGCSPSRRGACPGWCWKDQHRRHCYNPGLISPGPCPIFLESLGRLGLRNFVRNNAPDTLVPSGRPLRASRSPPTLRWPQGTQSRYTHASPFPPLSSEGGRLGQSGQGFLRRMPLRRGRRFCPRKDLPRLGSASSPPTSVSHTCQSGAVLRPQWGYRLRPPHQTVCDGGVVFRSSEHFRLPQLPRLCGASWQRRSRWGRGKLLAWLGGFPQGRRGGGSPSSERCPGSCLLVRCHVSALEGGAAPSSARLPPNRVHVHPATRSSGLDPQVGSRS